MKFSEIQEPYGGYVNKSDSYFLVLGINSYPSTNPSSIGISQDAVGELVDPENNTVDYFKMAVMATNQWDQSMTVWNGTTMESEPLTQIVSGSWSFEKTIMLIPPGFTFKNFGIAYGFWLSEEEVKQMSLGFGPFNIEKIKGGGIRL
ncbi:MAG: hypothetical protein QXO75_09270 [Nitrososphaerota archaeon]